MLLQRESQISRRISCVHSAWKIVKRLHISRHTSTTNEYSVNLPSNCIRQAKAAHDLNAVVDFMLSDKSIWLYITYASRLYRWTLSKLRQAKSYSLNTIATRRTIKNNNNNNSKAKHIEPIGRCVVRSFMLTCNSMPKQHIFYLTFNA